MFNKICGMTGTADTEALEFNQIYGLSVMVVDKWYTIKTYKILFMFALTAVII